MTDIARHGKPYIWPTWITGLISGEKKCQWAAWFKAHYQHDKRVDTERENTLARWTANHTEMVRKTTDALLATGYSVTVEDQNSFTYRGKIAVVGGKPDIMARDKSAIEIVDCKSGRDRGSDFVQVCIYVLLAPKCRDDLRSRDVTGRIVYLDRPDRTVSADDVASMESFIVDQVKRTSHVDPPSPTPSESECKFCDIASCPDRVSEQLEVEPEEGALF